MFLEILEENMVRFTKNEQNFLEGSDLLQNESVPLQNECDLLQIYDPPLIGVAGASDPLWEKLKEPNVVGPHHLTPDEWLNGAKSVISYFLPFTEHVRSSNRSEGMPSPEWLHGRYEGEMLNNALRSLISEIVEAEGGKALAPALDNRFTVNNHSSNWSERHVAFIAGLGTFSLSRALITSLGTAGRFGSVIVDLELEPKTRQYQEVDEYCIKCGACQDRCIIGAITANGKDKESCSKYLQGILELNKPRYGCGKCQTAVPCEHTTP